jgi:polyhydroxybutyrate depolymerase
VPSDDGGTGDVDQTLTDRRDRYDYRLAVPRSYDASRAVPLVVLFHGYGANAAYISKLTQLPARGAQRGFLVAAPSSPRVSWQTSTDGSDARFVDDLIAHLQATYCVDPSRVSLVGLSAGATFAIRYACSRAGRISSIATVTVEFQLGCTSPLSILAFHGTADRTVAYANTNKGYAVPGVKARGTWLNMGDWARLDGCRSTPTTRLIGSQVARTEWPGCRAQTDTILYTVLGGGHTWPGANEDPKYGLTTFQIDATDQVLDFFEAARG